MADLSQVTLNNGTPLDDKQKEALVQLNGLLQETISTAKIQVPVKKGKENPDHEKAVAVYASDKTLQQWVDGVTMRRYLVANKWEVPKAYEAILGTINYRSSHLTLTLTNCLSDPFDDCNNTCYMQWLGRDKEGFPSLFIRSRNADLNIKRERRLQYLEIALARGVQLMTSQYGGKDGIEQWNMIIDETDKEMKHMDNKFVKQISPILFGHYVERLRHCYIINAGVLTKAVLAIVKLMMDDRTKTKIHSYSTEKAYKVPGDKSTKFYHVPKLLAALGPENTPTEFGGTMQPMGKEEYAKFYNAIDIPSPVDVEHAKDAAAMNGNAEGQNGSLDDDAASPQGDEGICGSPANTNADGTVDLGLDENVSSPQ